MVGPEGPSRGRSTRRVVVTAALAIMVLSTGLQVILGEFVWGSTLVAIGMGVLLVDQWSASRRERRFHGPGPLRDGSGPHER